MLTMGFNLATSNKIAGLLQGQKSQEKLKKITKVRKIWRFFKKGQKKSGNLT